MTGNIENAARTLGDAIRSAAEIIAAALRQNSWTYQPYPVQTIPAPSIPYQPYTSPTIQPAIYPTVTCESNSSLPRTATGALCQNDAGIDRTFVSGHDFAGSAGDPDVRYSNRHD